MVMASQLSIEDYMPTSLESITSEAMEVAAAAATQAATLVTAQKKIPKTKAKKKMPLMAAQRKMGMMAKMEKTGKMGKKKILRAPTQVAH